LDSGPVVKSLILLGPKNRRRSRIKQYQSVRRCFDSACDFFDFFAARAAGFEPSLEMIGAKAPKVKILFATRIGEVRGQCTRPLDNLTFRGRFRSVIVSAAKQSIRRATSYEWIASLRSR
jgi:hypothetical protein